jgi:hypothetical protein
MALYNRKYYWKRHRTNIEETCGEHESEFDNLGELWASLEVQSATETTSDGSVISMTKGRIRILQKPSVRFKDQLEDMGTGEIWDIAGIVEEELGLAMDVIKIGDRLEEESSSS